MDDRKITAYEAKPCVGGSLCFLVVTVQSNNLSFLSP